MRHDSMQAFLFQAKGHWRPIGHGFYALPLLPIPFGECICANEIRATSRHGSRTSSPVVAFFLCSTFCYLSLQLTVFLCLVLSSGFGLSLGLCFVFVLFLCIFVF